MFEAMKEGIREETVGYLFNLDFEVVEEDDEEDEDEATPLITAPGLQPASTPQNLTYAGPSEDGEPQVRGSTTVTKADDPFASVGRNAVCPCGSGKKYKRCHGAPGAPTGLTTRVNG